MVLICRLDVYHWIGQPKNKCRQVKDWSIQRYACGLGQQFSLLQSSCYAWAITRGWREEKTRTAGEFLWTPVVVSLTGTYLESNLVGALSPVNRRGLYQGWGRFSQSDIYLKEPIRQEIRPEEKREKAESCRENLWNEIQLTGPYRHKACHGVITANRRTVSKFLCVVCEAESWFWVSSFSVCWNILVFPWEYRSESSHF